MVIITTQIMLECENPDVKSQDMVESFIAGISEKVPLWRAIPHDKNSMIWATGAKLVKVHWGAAKMPMRKAK